ncbi:serine threonine phosphatase [Raphidocelis subcapitata]|uniref:Serine threonine phosphatase n=1 Tax=Raphidocelis subcapitata TaxID=307507 RepID=A0A2V0PLF0_9CHLO|nr:serine threonine phosphatase [Raphidocelis subcapitata]|eukprot:GBG00547.1 serine threonine phosphatase [Raphidocelis subcapitata]
MDIASSSPELSHEEGLRAVKRPRVSPGPGDGDGGRSAAAAAHASGAAREAGALVEDQQQQQQQHDHKRQHGHTGHLRTHHTVDEPEEEGAERSGGGGGGGQRTREHSSRNGGGSAGAEAATKANGAAKLSFADELEEGGSGGDGDGGGGLRAATEDRFRAEGRAARHASARHAFHQRARSEEGGADAAAGGVAVVDEDAAGDAAANGGLAGGASARGPSLGRVHFGASSARGLRPYMEDRHCVVAAMQLLASSDGNGAQAGAPLPSDGIPRSYAAIFDGHNGAGCAELAAARLHVLLAAHPALRIHTGEPGPPAVTRAEEAAIGGALRSAFGAVDEATLAVARREGVRDGATALVVLRLGQVLYAAHAGDSRAVLCRDGSALRLTEDHKPHLPRERARIEDAGGRVDFQRCWRVVVEPRDGRPGSGLAVSRSLGDLDFKEPNKFVECEPDVLRVQLRPLQPSGAGDAFIILGSDGLWDVLSDEDAVHTAKRALQAYKTEHGRGNGDGEAKAAADALLDESLRRGTADNVTCVVMLLAWSGQLFRESWAAAATR